MTKQYILIKAFVLMAGWGTLGFSQSDTTVLNQAEFRFPETHPGEVFLVKKVILSPKGSLSKSAAVEASPSTSSSPEKPSAALASRDLRGRFTQGGEYQKRMERIRRKHGLPTLGASVQEAGRPFKAPKKFQMPEGSKFALTSNSPRIRDTRDLAALEKAERQAVRRKYGALSPEFSRQVDAMKDGEEVEVVVELAIASPGYVNGSKATEAERIANARAWARAKPLTSPAGIKSRYGLTSRHNEVEKAASRILVVRASKGSLRAMAHDRSIVSVTPYVEPKTATVPGSGPRSYMDAVNSAYNPPGDMVNHGGRVAATFELGLSPQYVACADPGLRPVGYGVSSWGWAHEVTAHSEGMYNLLALGTPDNSRYHFNNYSNGYYFVNLADSLLTLNVDVISTSFVTQWDGETVADSRFVDRQAYVYPYPLFSLAAGNWGHNEVPISRTYNSLIVGNVQHYDNSTYTVNYQFDPGGGAVYFDHLSMSRNPDAKYGSVRDWELPTLIAPGVTPDPYWGMIDGDSCVYGQGGVHQWSGNGTSLSAPVAAAMATNVIAARGNYTTPIKPLEAKAILMLTSQNVDSGYWDPVNQDSRDGAGTVSGASAVNFSVNVPNSISPEDQAVVEGLGAGYIDSATFLTYPTYRYNIATPSEIPQGKHLRVVLTWTSSPGTNVAENEVSDLALSVSINGGWMTSDTWNSNAEIVDVPSEAMYGSAGYEILITPITYRQAADGPNHLHYTVAWAWVKDHAD